MATASMIDRAAQPDKAPVISPFFYESGESTLTVVKGRAEVEEKIRHKAITKLFWRFGALHGCTFEPPEGDRPAKKCTRKRHKRDMAACREALETLGLLGGDEPLDDLWDEIEPAPAPARRSPCRDWSWADRAACRGSDLVLFFGPDGERQREKGIREKEAKAICARCPVRGECFDSAQSRPERYGVYGGFNEDERAYDRRRQMRRAATVERARKATAPDPADEGMTSAEVAS